MKFKNPQGKEIGAFATVVGGVVLGAMLSDGVVSLIHTPTAGADATTAKKEETMLLAKRGAIIVASTYAGAGVSGTDTTSVLAKSALYGMAAKQTINVVSNLASKNSKLVTPTTKVEKFASAALGLSCPETTAVPALYGYNRKRRGMKVPAVDFNNLGSNSLDNAVNMGAQLAMS